MRRFRAALWRGWPPVLILVLAACSQFSDTRVDTSHPLISSAPDAQSAKVYFLRPLTERAMGYADNALTVMLDGRKLLTIGKGDYTLIYMQPRVHTSLTLENLTAVGPARSAVAQLPNEPALWPRHGDWPVKTMSKNYDFGFEAGVTYFIVLEPVDGEFRGVYFTAKGVDPYVARETAHNLNPIGAAKKAPIAAI